MKQIINELKGNCAPGCDNVTKKDIIDLYHIIGDSIVNIINTVLESGVYPEELKIGKIIPIYKKGNRTDVNNYRPISLLSNFSKILEKIVKIRLTRFIDTTFLFDEKQYGFQKQSNTLGATVDLLEYITKEIDQNRYIAAVFIDLQKAFDTVNIELLLEKLNKMGFRGVCQNLLKTYTVDRKQYTVVNKIPSEKTSVRVGVPQGSVLGPLQYLLFVHSLKFADLKSKYFMFADDTVIVYSSENQEQLEQTINSDLKTYFEWLCYNELTINTEKTVYMIIKQKGKKSIKPVIKINNKVLKEVTQYNYLGLIISNDLRFNDHVQHIIKKLTPAIGSIRRCANQLNRNARYLLYNSVIEPHLRYLIPCWGNTSELMLNKLQRCQNKAIKSIFALEYYTQTEYIYEHYPFLTIRQIKGLEQSKLIYYIQNNLLKSSIILNKNKDIHTYNLRTTENIRKNYARTKKCQDSPIGRSIQMYNEIPKDIITKKAKKTCRNLKTYIKNNYI